MDWRGISLTRTALLRLRQRQAQVVPYRRARLRLRGEIDGGGRLEIGSRWPDRGFPLTEFILREGGRCSVEGTFLLYAGCTVVIEGGAELSLGGGFVNNGSSIVCHTGIAIGNGAMIGPEVDIRDGDSHTISGSGRASAEPIRIGNDVWIGARAMILKGVTIGDRAIVAAGAIVTADVESGTLVAGVPARPVRAATWVP